MTSRIGLAIDQNTNDLFLRASGELAIVKDAEAVGQHARQRLMTFQREWFLDTTAGVVWLDEIMGRQYDPALAEAVVKNEILNTDGVDEITSFSVRFNRGTRQLAISSVNVRTDYDQEVSL
ncbi:hypothetical protein HQ945_08315 [Phyllobacterium sp. BT25]|uniref:DUF2634 domain-containing protein n=1 Tax=Phyllobacterium pellucidum TaxID=2740464 RepID=A0A849VT35_9HYPH|nr:hypothetical protein [Phyllobacterium pellucidum]NTS31257.1 hypothetical protein [Phyllobacterium pellucidum]